MLRRLIKTTEDISNRCYLGKDSLEAIMNSTEKQIFNLMQSQGGGEFVPIRQVVINSLEKSKQLQSNLVR